MLYFANPTGLGREAMIAGHLGMIATPKQGNLIPEGVTWCADNGIYGNGWPGDEAWFAWLASRTPEQISRCLFAAAPDVIGDAAATLKRSTPWLPRIRDLGYPAAFVAQDGLEHLPIPWEQFDVLFVGGTTAWKLDSYARQIITEAHSHHKWVHMGRVNSERRLRYAQAVGCDSADGTYLTYGPNVNLPSVLAWLRGVNHQTAIGAP